MIRWVFAIQCLAGAQAVDAGRDGGATVFQGASDASAAVALTDDVVVVADDETNALRAYRIKEAGPPIWQLPLDSFLDCDTEHPEADIEAGARIGNRIYWLSDFPKHI